MTRPSRQASLASRCSHCIGGGFGRSASGYLWRSDRSRAVPGGLDQFGSKHLTLYEYNGDIASLREHLLARVESGNVASPEWYDRVSFVTWNCEPIGEWFEALRRFPLHCRVEPCHNRVRAETWPTPI